MVKKKNLVVLNHPNIKGLSIERSEDQVKAHEAAGWKRASKAEAAEVTNDQEEPPTVQPGDTKK